MKYRVKYDWLDSEGLNNVFNEAEKIVERISKRKSSCIRHFNRMQRTNVRNYWKLTGRWTRNFRTIRKGIERKGL
jgi:hypothetical protein